MNAEIPSIEYVSTSDGARIAIKRKPRAGGVPVIFLHGLAVNADLWDLPSLDGPEFRYRSLATLLYDAGFDIWLVNLRGHGAPAMLSTPAPGQTDWCVDHFVTLDLPAVCDHVLSTTRRKPFVIGASMGAMTLAGYVQGAVLAGTHAAPCVALDSAVAERRQSELAGAIFAEFPAALRWPHSLYDEKGGLRWSALLRDFWRSGGDANFPFEVLARLGWLETLIDSAGGVSLQWMKPDPIAPSLLNSLPAPLIDWFRRFESGAVQAGLNLVGTFTGHSNHRAEVILRGRRFVIDDMKAGVLRQMRRGVHAGEFVSGLGEPPHVYSNYYDRTTLPTLVLAGGRDRIAVAEVTRAVFHDRIASRDKTMLTFDTIAHGELEAAPWASENVYPRVLDWLTSRISLSGTD